MVGNPYNSTLEGFRQEFGEILRERRAEYEPVAGARMIEGKFPRVKEMASQCLHRAPDTNIADRVIAASSIARVSYYGVPNMRKMHSNLMSTPGLDLHFQ